MMTSLFSDTSLWDVLGWTMLHFLWMGSIAFAVSAGVRWSVRRCSAGLRYSVALLCLLGVAATAAVAISVSLRQIGRAASASEPVSMSSEPTSAGAPPLPMDWMQRGRFSQRTAALSEPANRNLTAQEALRLWIYQGTLNTLARLLPWLWVCGTPLVALALLTGIIGASRLRRRSTEVSDEQLQGRMQRLRTLLGISRRVGLAVCDQVSSPLVIGIFRPLIILPPAMISGLAPAQLEMILLHELAHVRRWDNLVNLMQRMIEALLFFHPAVWWASRWVRLEREHCCDALVLSHNHTPQSYAETLAALALPELAPQFATAAMANHQLTSRICHILKVEERSMGISVRTLLGGIVLLAAGAGGFLLATLRAERVVAEDPAPATSSESEPADSEPGARLMFGVGVNSDAGVMGHIVVDDDADEPLEEVLGLGPDDGLPIGKSLSTWGRHAWCANEATGPPDVPEAGDSEQAWASLTEDGQPEWLRLTFDAPVNAAAIMVYESFNPGALTRITTVNSDGAEVVLWEGKDPVAAQEERGVAIVILHDAPELTEVTLHLDSPAVAGWNEIDAVGLIDHVTGEVRWAASAEASSSYADRSDYEDFEANGFADFFAGSMKQCQNCHAGVHGASGRCPASSHQRIQKLRAELQRLQTELEHEEAVRAQAQYAEQVRAAEAQLRASEFWGNAVHEFQQAQEDAAPVDELQELRQTLQQQQQAIERMTDMLEHLQRRLAPFGGGQSEPDEDGQTGALNAPATGPTPQAIETFPSWDHVTSRNAIDDFVRKKLKGLALEGSQEVSDEVFVRRVYLDLLGRVSTPEETQQFLDNESPTSREELIDSLLLQSAQTHDAWSQASSFWIGEQE